MDSERVFEAALNQPRSRRFENLLRNYSPKDRAKMERSLRILTEGNRIICSLAELEPKGVAKEVFECLSNAKNRAAPPVDANMAGLLRREGLAKLSESEGGFKITEITNAGNAVLAAYLFGTCIVESALKIRKEKVDRAYS